MIARRTAVLGGLALLAGCAARPTPGPRPARDGGPVTTGRPIGWGDDKPVVWPGRTPAAYPVHGIDLSRFQSDIDWRAGAAAGVSFAFVKATEGGDLTDPMLAANLAGARAAGVPVGAYHFHYFCTEPEVQARWFIRNVPKSRLDLPPVLDLEWNPFSPTCTRRPPPEQVRDAASRVIALMSDAYGQRPIIYTTPDFWVENQIARLGGEFWLRAVTRHPAEAYPGARWTFWQYSGTGRIPGAPTRIDLNAFNGSVADWAAWLERRRIR